MLALIMILWYFSHTVRPGSEVIIFSCSTQLSMKFQLLIETKIPTNKEVSCFILSDVVFIMLINVNINEHDKFHAQLS